MGNETTLVNKYSNSPYLRSLISLVPYIGSPIDILLTNKSSKWKQERLNLVLTDLDQKVRRLDLSVEEVKSRIESEEFYDNLIKVLELSSKTRRKEKIQAFSNILTNQINNKLTETIDGELAIIIIDSMSIAEVEYLSELSQTGGTISVHLLDSKLVDIETLKDHLIKSHIVPERFSGIPENCLNKLGNQIIWKFLSDKNLVNIDQSRNSKNVPYSFGSSNMWTNTSITTQGEIKYELSDFGKEFVKWIKVQ